MSVNSAAIATYPLPQASPAAIERKITAMSLALPGTDRNRTRLNAPATATPVPTFPFTSRMTVCTMTGSRISVSTKLCVYRARRV